MLRTEKVNIKLNNINIKHYSKIYENLKINDTIEVDIENVTKGSHVIVEVSCDNCGELKQMKYQTYNKYTSNNTKNYYCTKCVKAIRTIKTMNEKYGVDYPLQNEKIKQKFINTNLKKYGTEYAIQNDEILHKRNNTNIKRYGTEHVSLNEDIRRKQTISRVKNIINKIGYEFLDYDFDKHLIKTICDKGHVFEVHSTTIYNRIKYVVCICPICNPISKQISNKENKLLEFIKENYDNKIIENSKEIITPYELDIYLPELKLAFEFNGLYWHNELYKPKDYHKIKSDLCEEKGIQLVHIWEDDWQHKQDIVKSIILNKLGRTPNKILVSKCTIKELDDNELHTN